MDIIIADDEPVTRLLLEESLSSWGYTVHAAERGDQVLALLEGKPEIQLLLLDWSMPELSGIELCKVVKSDTDLIRYVIMLTSKSGVEHVVEALDSGADDFLTKPFIPGELKVRLRAGCRIIEQEQKLQLYANTDALTGVLNKRMILQCLEKEWSRSSRERGNLIICILDLDYFKSINDNYGHQAGDEVLKLFCDEVYKQIRPYDYFGRYGGEEFLLVMPMAKQQDCLFIAERIRDAISNAALVLQDGAEVKFTVSIGCTNIHNDDKSVEDATARAESAVYSAKEAGRNKVVIF